MYTYIHNLMITPRILQTLDLKGREKFLGQMSVQGYCGCAKCTLAFPQGVGGVCYDVSRRYLPPGDPLRQRICGPFQYPAAEVSVPAPQKTTAFVHMAAEMALQNDYEHYLGQKCHPMFELLSNYVYENMNIADWMHNLAR